MNFKKNYTWACDRLKNSNLSADNFKKILTLMGQHLSPRYGQVILVSRCPVLTAVNWSQHWCPKCVHYQFSCAPKLARKYEIEHWCPVVRTDGRCTVTWLPNFLGWVDFLSYGAPPTRARSTRMELRYKITKIALVLWLAERHDCTKVCKQSCDLKMLCCEGQVYLIYPLPWLLRLGKQKQTNMLD